MGSFPIPKHLAKNDHKYYDANTWKTYHTTVLVNYHNNSAQVHENMIFQPIGDPHLAPGFGPGSNPGLQLMFLALKSWAVS